jgi:hypothetical protein
MIFVFGSNLAGRHGAGAALYAQRHHGAVKGHGIGRCGNSYAIPTKSRDIKTLPLESISYYVTKFRHYAWANPDLTFQVTRIGCGLAGYADAEIAPLFQPAPSNCLFDEKWKPYLGEEKRYWGTG